MTAYSAIDVARRFLELAQAEAGADVKKDISNMKLQKLCFFAQLVSLCVDASAPIIADHFHAWDYGPVEPKLFRLIRGFGARHFSLDDANVASAFAGAKPVDDVEAQKIIDVVWGKFKTWTAVELSALTHRKNSPWSVVYSATRYAVIPNETIVKYMWGSPE